MSDPTATPLTVRRWLQATFAGFDPTQVRDLAAWGDAEIRDARLCSTATYPGAPAEPAWLQASCSDTCLVSFRAAGLGGALYLVHDDSEGERWDARRQRGELPHACPPRPHAVLRLVRSA